MIATTHKIHSPNNDEFNPIASGETPKTITLEDPTQIVEKTLFSSQGTTAGVPSYKGRARCVKKKYSRRLDGMRPNYYL